jgi:hypothetical protein
VIVSSRRVVFLLVLPAMVIAAAGCEHPPSQRVTGTVVSVRTSGDVSTVCLTGVRNSGSSDGNLHEHECLSGVVVGYTPKRGDCVTAVILGVSGERNLRRATGC